MIKLNYKSILGACLEECIHVAGILNYFQFARQCGYKTSFLGPAVKIPDLINAIKKSTAGIVAISYRLTPENGKQHVDHFVKEIKDNYLYDRKFYFGGLPELAKYAKSLNFFDVVCEGGETLDDLLPKLKGIDRKDSEKKDYPSDLISRIEYKNPYPVLRAHFGLPSLEDTYSGIKQIAGAKVLDVISIAPDQAAQENLQRPSVLKKLSKGSGGAPIRSREDLEKMYKLSRRGNFPLLRIYSGTQDLRKNARLFQETIHNAWAAIPIFWYSKLDGRGPLEVEGAISEHFDAIQWHAKRNIPVEVNDPHQWGLRMAPDHLVVADAYLSARIAKSLGVKTYIEQLMFNTPSGNNFKMDLARVLAMIEIVQPLQDNSFKVLKQTRAGLSYFSPKLQVAIGQLCTSTVFQMAVKPQILHVVSYCEGDHAASPEEIINSCTILKRVIQDCYSGMPDLIRDPEVQDRKNELLTEASYTLNGIFNLRDNFIEGYPLLSPQVLASVVKKGILDAPQLIGNDSARGTIRTSIIDGKCVAVDKFNDLLDERDRLESLGISIDDSREVSDQQVYNRIYGGV
ncbi:MAG: methionine synthase [Candidatus Hodarchaeota archaeon]